MKNCIIYQPQGIGDILLCEPIARFYKDLGYNIEWGVIEQYFWIKDYIKYVNFFKTKMPIKQKSIFNKEEIILSLINVQGHFVYEKYKYSNVNIENYKNFKWERNLDKEKKLFEELNLKKPYSLINKNFYTKNINSRIEIKSKNNNFINMFFYKDYTLLDWGYILENAEEIHTVDTSLVWLIESKVLNINAKLHLYPRLEHTNKINPNVISLLKKKWILHE